MTTTRTTDCATANNMNPVTCVCRYEPAHCQHYLMEAASGKARGSSTTLEKEGSSGNEQGAQDVETGTNGTAADAMVTDTQPNNGEKEESPKDAPQDDENSEEAKRKKEAYENMQRIMAEFDEIRNKLFSEKLADLKVELQDVNEGRHKDLIEETENLARVREEKLKLAERQHELELEALKKVYAAEKKQVEDEFESDKHVLKQRLLQYITYKQKKMEEEKAGFTLDDEDKPARRRQKKHFTEPVLQPAPAKKRALPPIQYSLKEADILEDLISIQRVCFPSGTRSSYGGSRRSTVNQ